MPYPVAQAFQPGRTAWQARTPAQLTFSWFMDTPEAHEELLEKSKFKVQSWGSLGPAMGLFAALTFLPFSPLPLFPFFPLFPQRPGSGLPVGLTFLALGPGFG